MSRQRPRAGWWTGLITVLGRLQVRQEFKADQIGHYSLAGAQMKLSGEIVWVYRCLACGAYGPAEPH